MQVMMSNQCKRRCDSIILLTDWLAKVGISNTEVAAMKDLFAHQVATGRSQPVPSFSQGRAEKDAEGGTEPTDLKADSDFTGTVYTFRCESEDNANMLKDFDQAQWCIPILKRGGTVINKFRLQRHLKSLRLSVPSLNVPYPRSTRKNRALLTIQIIIIITTKNEVISVL